MKELTIEEYNWIIKQIEKLKDMLKDQNILIESLQKNAVLNDKKPKAGDTYVYDPEKKEVIKVIIKEEGN